MTGFVCYYEIPFKYWDLYLHGNATPSQVAIRPSMTRPDSHHNTLFMQIGKINEHNTDFWDNEPYT